MLKKRIEFLRTYKTKPVFTKFFKLYVLPNEFKSNRLGITVPKTAGNAVLRNKYKRWAKEVFRDYKSKSNKNQIYNDFHIFITLKQKDEKITWEEFKKEFSGKLKVITGDK